MFFGMKCQLMRHLLRFFWWVEKICFQTSFYHFRWVERFIPRRSLNCCLGIRNHIHSWLFRMRIADPDGWAVWLVSNTWIYNLRQKEDASAPPRNSQSIFIAQKDIFSQTWPYQRVVPRKLYMECDTAYHTCTSPFPFFQRCQSGSEITQWGCL